MTNTRIWFVVILVLKLLDIVTTYMGIKFYGVSEANPITGFMIYNFGLIGGLIVNYLMFLAIMSFPYFKGNLKLFKIIALIQFIVIVNNIIVILIRGNWL